MRVQRRYLLVGNSGSGKSTLAARLAARDRIAHLDLDTLAWLPRTPPAWVVEGCYADLLACVAPQATTLVFLNPGVDACIEHARQRPWEPHKYNSKAAQDANLEMLIAWIRGYDARTDELSLSAHRTLFEGFAGEKIELTSPAAIAAFA
jgi:cytidylate kinase